ncbi:hypothetical protein Taro_008796 [Colocasia esculenta]|uniref:Uncharacterized protein n=1 Tax=Colocasia esculenta TaxID=4460 RepID=A0A843U248_COLES|nr:hypothetical protein [Colocasia esculenta]
MKGSRRSLNAAAGWVRRQPPKVKAFLAVVAGMAALVFLRFVVHDHDNLFVASEACHAIGISVLIYKLTKEKTCAVRKNGPNKELEDQAEGGQVLEALGEDGAGSHPEKPRGKRDLKGLSLKSQELTALFLAVRLYCSFVMEYDIHTLLDTATLVTTLWVIYMFRFKLRSSYMEDQDNFAIYYILGDTNGGCWGL